ncbi:hypothetical protein M9978_01640 [Sphingomonas sp. MG17]|uniref:Uncharacterized protein n=1 Tax=Sphingomonas tagetis TaxID=2949092 RepID=A0A9X2HH71_9SPHN|nr:hypothetical protein [Sphingomonas tagetis]MCP3729119.1 hypothetical protein [Sphingomonas tagetis]
MTVTGQVDDRLTKLTQIAGCQAAMEARARPARRRSDICATATRRPHDSHATPARQLRDGPRHRRDIDATKLTTEEIKGRPFPGAGMQPDEFQHCNGEAGRRMDAITLIEPFCLSERPLAPKSRS